MEEEVDSRRTHGRAKVVGRGLLAPYRNPEDPQWYLAYSDHPYAPFPGNALKWDSFVYDDGTTYEGLTREYIPHGKGVMMFGQGTGAGIQTVDPGDKYEGEFMAGFANGLGAYTAKSGEVYRGEWLYGKRHGCGAATDFTPFYNELKRGSTVSDAWKKTRNYILNQRMRYGHWKGNKFVQHSGGDQDLCNVHVIRGMLQEMESVVTKARMFQHKPDGDVTHMARRDKEGKPIPTFQDPLHYPHATMFLAPGPIGQCHPIPQHAGLKQELQKHARNFMRIYNSYNLPYLARPGDDLFAAARLDNYSRAQDELYRRLGEGEDEDTVRKDIERKFNEPSEEAKEYMESKNKGKKGQKGAAKQNPRAAKAAARAKQQREQQRRQSAQPAPAADDDLSDDDLLASSSDIHTGPNSAPPSVFCSLSGRSHHLTGAVKVVAQSVSRHWLPRIQRKQPFLKDQLVHV